MPAANWQPGFESLGDCGMGWPDYRYCSSMKKLLVFVLLASAWVTLLSGCASQGPSPEQQTRDADEQRQAEQQQAEFRKGLPPVTNPGRGQ